MKQNTSQIVIDGIVGTCGSQKVFMGFASAALLHDLSFADILDEDTGLGYQRPYNKQHSSSFREYIVSENSSTIPLTFNLRKDLCNFWTVDASNSNAAKLVVSRNAKVLAQVDCQHRLGELRGVNVPLAFMSYIGLGLREEMALFTIINSKAKGLSSSLTDFHESNLLSDLAVEAPHLFIARKLNEDTRSPWYKLIRYGGESTSGLKRRTSFRMMQIAVSKCTKKMNSDMNVNELYYLIRNFWIAVKSVFPQEWGDHRHHLLTKGIGLYSLMLLLADIVALSVVRSYEPDVFAELLELLKERVDWKSTGTFSDAGGQKGAIEAYMTLKGLLIK